MHKKRLLLNVWEEGRKGSILSLHESLERVDGTDDLFRIRAERDAEVTRQAEGIARHEDQAVGQRLSAERGRVALQRLGEEVERAARTHDVKAQRRQRVVEEIHVRLIHGEVAGQVAAIRRRQLDDRGRAVVADAARNLAAHVDQHGGNAALRVHGHIADALAGNRQALGEGIAGDRARVEPRRIRNLPAVEGDFAIWLVGDQPDVVAERLFLLQQQRRHPAERFGGIDRAGGVVRRVDEHGLHGGGQHPLKRIEIDLEGLRVGGHDAQRQPRARRVGAILREEWREGQNFVSGLGYQPEGVRQRARRAAGHKNIVHRVAHAEPAVERRGDLFARGGDAQTRAVPVHEHRVAAVQQRLDARVECLRHGHGRVAQAVIEHILRFQVRMPEFPIVKDTTPNITNPRLYDTA